MAISPAIWHNHICIVAMNCAGEKELSQIRRITGQGEFQWQRAAAHWSNSVAVTCNTKQSTFYYMVQAASIFRFQLVTRRISGLNRLRLHRNCKKTQIMCKTEGGDAGDALQKSDSDRPAAEFKVLKESEVYSGYLSVYNRRVRFPDKSATGEKYAVPPEYNYDVIGHPRANFHFCICFPYHPPAEGNDWRNGEVTLIREYAQGPNEVMYGLPAGSLQKEKHLTLEDCVMAELSEEVRF